MTIGRKKRKKWLNRIAKISKEGGDRHPTLDQVLVRAMMEIEMLEPKPQKTGRRMALRLGVSCNCASYDCLAP